MRVWIALAALVSLGHAESVAQEMDSLAIDPPTPADVAEAMTSEWALMFPYVSDGTAAGDTTVRMAGLGVADLEGGDGPRGLRLVAGALRRGVVDSAFHYQAAVFVGAHRQRRLAIALYLDGIRRWPNSVQLWRRLSDELGWAGRAAEAASASARATELEQKQERSKH